MAYELIETVEVGAGGAASIEFTSIPQDGTDLVVVLSGRTSRSGTDDTAKITFNNDNGNNYSFVYLQGDGGAASSFSNTLNRFIPSINGNTSTANTFSNLTLYVSNYTSTTNKSVAIDFVWENNSSYAVANITAGSYSTTSAISTVTLTGDFNSFVEYSTASLYKITAA